MKLPIQKVDRLIQAIDAWILKEDEELEEELKAEGYVAVGAAVLVMSKLEEAITNALNANTDKFLKQLKTAASLEEFLQDSWSVMQIEKELEDALKNIFQNQFPSLMEECVHSFLLEGDKVLAEEALAIDRRITKPAQAFIESWSSQLASLMQLSTNQQIEKILLDSQEKAMSIQQVADAIANSGIRSVGYRARRVAQTEVLRIESYAQLECMRQDPSVEEKEWMHTGAHKNKPRANHVAMNGTRVAVEEKFELEGMDSRTYFPMCPRDICLPASETVNCHCIMRPIRNEEILGMSVEERRALRKKRMDEVDAEWERIQQTGGKFTTVYEREMYRDSQAEKYYEKIRKADDIKIIAEVSGMSEEDIETIKNHVFFNKHILYDNIEDRFAADYDMAVAWKRLSEGVPEDRDLLLLKHELLESQVEKEYNLTASEAHVEATKTYDWSGEILKILGEGGEDIDLL